MQTGEVSCDLCSASVLEDCLFTHIEDNHVGPRSIANLYDIICGNCDFRVCENSGSSIINHCHNTKHQASNLRIDWNDFMSQERQRVAEIVASGVQSLNALETLRAPMRSIVVLESEVAPVNSSSERLKPNSQLEEDDDIMVTSESKPSKLKRKRRHRQSETVSKKVSKPHHHPEPQPKTVDSTKKLQSLAVPIPVPEQEDQKPEIGKLILSQNEQANETAGEVLTETSIDDSSLPQSTGNNSDFQLAENVEKPSDSMRKSTIAEKEPENDGTQSTTASVVCYERVVTRKNPELEDTEDGEEKIKITCEFCSKILASKKVHNNFRQQIFLHSLTHSGLKFIKCTDCSAEIVAKNGLKDHLQLNSCSGDWNNIRTDEKLHDLKGYLRRCFPGFDFSSELSNSSLLGYKKRSRTGEADRSRRSIRNWTCRLCSRVTSPSRTSGFGHVLAHSKLKLFRCKGCDTHYSILSNLAKHTKNKTDGSPCDGTYANIQTSGDAAQIRHLLTEAFPDVDWDAKIPRGTEIYGILL